MDYSPFIGFSTLSPIALFLWLNILFILPIILYCAWSKLAWLTREQHSTLYCKNRLTFQTKEYWVVLVVCTSFRASFFNTVEIAFYLARIATKILEIMFNALLTLVDFFGLIHHTSVYSIFFNFLLTTFYSQYHTRTIHQGLKICPN